MMSFEAADSEKVSMQINEDIMIKAIIASMTMLPNRPRAWLRKYGKLTVVGVQRHLVKDYKDSCKEAVKLAGCVEVSGYGDLLSTYRYEGGL